MSAKNRALLYVALIFFSGALAGGMFMSFAEHYWLHPRQAAAAPPWESDRQHSIELFKRQLNLTDDQTRQLETILDETMRQYEDLHSFTHHIRDDGLMRIRAMLNDNQRKEFDTLTRRMETPEQMRQRRLREMQQQQSAPPPARQQPQQ